jgi:hypothetical protein
MLQRPHALLVCRCHGCHGRTDAPDASHSSLLLAADFGVSRVLAGERSHISTRSYGTVSAMPPELLASGRLEPACDVYSYGIFRAWQLPDMAHGRQLPPHNAAAEGSGALSMSCRWRAPTISWWLTSRCAWAAVWELVHGTQPWPGMLHGEIIHRVVSQQMRPSFPPGAYGGGGGAACLHCPAAAAPPAGTRGLQAAHSLQPAQRWLIMSSRGRLPPAPPHTCPHPRPAPAGMLPEYVDLAAACWAEDPAARPDFPAIQARVEALMAAAGGA